LNAHVKFEQRGQNIDTVARRSGHHSQVKCMANMNNEPQWHAAQDITLKWSAWRIWTMNCVSSTTLTIPRRLAAVCDEKRKVVKSEVRSNIYGGST